jgi:hypothetical protein
MKRFLTWIAALATLGCGSSDEKREFTECGPITGGFQVTERLESGTCPLSTDPFTINVAAKPDQTANVEFPDFGIQCGGVAVNGCSLRGNCATRAGMPPIVTGNVSVDLTIQPAGIQGSYSVTLNPGAVADVPNGCTGRFTISGTRR